MNPLKKTGKRLVLEIEMFQMIGYIVGNAQDDVIEYLHAEIYKNTEKLTKSLQHETDKKSKELSNA